MRHRDPRLLALALSLLLLGGLSLRLIGQEIVTLTTPITKPSTTVCQLDSILLDIAGKRIVAALSCPNGDPITKQYDAFTSPTGAALLSTLNISNNSAGNSLIKKAYAQLIANGVITGTVTGTAQ